MGNTTVNMNSNNGTCSFTITTDSSWEISNPSNLVLVNKSTQEESSAAKIEGEGITLYTIRVPQNNTSTQREFTITVKLTGEWCDNVSIVTHIIQEGNN